MVCCTVDHSLSVAYCRRAAHPTEAAHLVNTLRWVATSYLRLPTSDLRPPTSHLHLTKISSSNKQHHPYYLPR